MLKFAANISFLFSELPFLERFAAAKAAGFRAVEFHFPYSYDLDSLTEVVLTSEIEVVLFNLPAGTAVEWSGGQRGMACHPDRVAEFEAGVKTAIAYAQTLGCRRLNCLAGIPPVGISLATAEKTLISNFRHAAEKTYSAGIELVLEPLNTRDNQHFLISTSAQALTMIDAVGCDNLRLQYDIYHAQVMKEDLVGTLRQLLPRIGHIQVADNPGRHEPGSGEIDFRAIFSVLDEMEYPGWVGCEYIPSATSTESLTWLEAWLKPSSCG